VQHNDIIVEYHSHIALGCCWCYQTPSGDSGVKLNKWATLQALDQWLKNSEEERAKDSILDSFRCRTVMVVVLPDPFRGLGAWRNSTETKQPGHAQRSGPEVKNGSSAKDGAPRRAQMWNNPGGESDPAECVHRRCIKNYSPFV